MNNDNCDDTIQAFQALFERRERKRTEEVQHLVAAHPQAINCTRHPNIIRPISLERTRESGEQGSEMSARYEYCRLCVEEHNESETRQRLHRQGVPTNLLHATLDNWTPDANDAGHLEFVRSFTIDKRGFLVLLGTVGTGKTHLSVGIMRHFKNAYFVKQSTLLRRLRETYRNHAAIDPVAECQKAGLLVLDEMGISSGGRDEDPLLYEVLDYRHGERKPTILTSNLDWERFTDALGERMGDRLRESASRVLTFPGNSHRSEARERYFETIGDTKNHE